MNPDYQKSLFVVDGTALLFRAYYSMPLDLTSPSGMHTGALQGFTGYLFKLIKQYAPGYAVMTFDAGRRNFRHDIYPEYKANRDETPEELVPQLSWAPELSEGFGFLTLVRPGYEADDIISTVCGKIKPEKEIIIVSRDKDLAQLVNKKVRILNLPDDKIMDEQGVVNKFGVFPKQMPDFLAMVGDSVDNIPGIKGVGPKTAAIVLLFSMGRPAFPVDTHVHRVTKRLGLIGPRVSREKAHVDLEHLVPSEAYYAFHLNLIRHGRQVCSSRKPRCQECSLQDLCDYYQQLQP